MIAHDERVFIFLRDSDDITACHFGWNIDHGGDDVKQARHGVYDRRGCMLDMLCHKSMRIRSPVGVERLDCQGNLITCKYRRRFTIY